MEFDVWRPCFATAGQEVAFYIQKPHKAEGGQARQIPNIVACGSWVTVIATSALGLVSEKLPDFQVIIRYNPFESSEDEIYIHETYEVIRRARTRSLNNAVKTIHKGWGAETLGCDLDAVKKIDLESVLERAILNRNIQVRCLGIASIANRSGFQTDWHPLITSTPVCACIIYFRTSWNLP